MGQFNNQEEVQKAVKKKYGVSSAKVTEITESRGIFLSQPQRHILNNNRFDALLKDDGEYSSDNIREVQRGFTFEITQRRFSLQHPKGGTIEYFTEVLPSGKLSCVVLGGECTPHLFAKNI